MSLEALRNRLPDYAKDQKLNLGSLATEPVLTEQQRAGTFIVGDTCTWTDVALPTTFRSVAINPRTSTRKPEPRDVGDQTATTLSCHFSNRSDEASPGATVPVADGDVVNGTTWAFSAVSASAASRPATTSTTCAHW